MKCFNYSEVPAKVTKRSDDLTGRFRSLFHDVSSCFHASSPDFQVASAEMLLNSVVLFSASFSLGKYIKA